MEMAREAATLQASGRRILHLEVGQPSTPLPLAARAAVRAHLDEPLGYTNAAGLHSLRRRLADRYDGVGPERVVVVAGASAGFTLAFLTLFEKQIIGSLFGSANIRKDIPQLLELYTQGQLDLDTLVTNTYTLDEINQGFEDMRNGKNIRGVLIYD